MSSVRNTCKSGNGYSWILTVKVKLVHTIQFGTCTGLGKGFHSWLTKRLHIDRSVTW